jgi:hypothetical protein
MRLPSLGGGDAYDEWADTRSWDSMAQFLKENFGEMEFVGEPPARTNVETVDYVDEIDGMQLKGYLAKPDETKWEMPAPAVVIFP